MSYIYEYTVLHHAHRILNDLRRKGKMPPSWNETKKAVLGIVWPMASDRR
jgi:hypothetical protein